MAGPLIKTSKGANYISLSSWILIGLLTTIILFISFTAFPSPRDHFIIRRRQATATTQPYNFNWSNTSPHCQQLVRELEETGQGTHFWSHDGQDFYTFLNHFRHLERNGTYLDIASANAAYASTTYFYDHCLGWRGVCVEANAKHHAEYPSMRTCDLVPRCVSSNEGEVVSFHEDPQEELQSGVVDSNYTNPHIRGNVTSMTCTTVANILKERGITHVDYLSLDVEGHELQVLKGIDLNTVRIDVITIEVKPQFLEEVPRFMNESGYYRHPIHASEKTEKYPYLFIEDQLYIRRGVVFGEPQ